MVLRFASITRVILSFDKYIFQESVDEILPSSFMLQTKSLLLPFKTKISLIIFRLISLVSLDFDTFYLSSNYLSSNWTLPVSLIRLLLVLLLAIHSLITLSFPDQSILAIILPVFALRISLIWIGVLHQIELNNIG